MNSTAAESSFAPLEYYKKLTSCLANRKNLKLNLSKIAGAKEIYNKKNVNLITNRKLQAKFLSKYTLKKLQENQKKKETENKQQNPEVLDIFKINEAEKRKRDESFIYNLPDSMFKSLDKPNISLFKVPEPPAVKKQKSNEIIANSISSNNFTIASLFSANFKPQQHSTPKELPKPIISDFNEVLELPQNPTEQQNTRNEKFSAYSALLDNTAKYMDSVIFEKSDPTVSIVRKLNQMYQSATQSPRESLLSTQGRNPASKEGMLKRTSRAWPVPVFYGENVDEVRSDGKNSKIGSNSDNIKNFGSRHDEIAIPDILIEEFNSFESKNKELQPIVIRNYAPEELEPIRSKSPIFRAKSFDIQPFDSNYSANDSFMNKLQSFSTKINNSQSFNLKTTNMRPYNLENTNKRQHNLKPKGFQSFEPENDTSSLSFDQTNDLFSFLDDQDDFAPLSESKSEDFNSTQSTNFLFATPSIWSSPPTNSFIESPFLFNVKKDDNLDWLEAAFNTQMDMSWESDSSFSISPVKHNNNYDRGYISPIFRSPPQTGRLFGKEKFSRTISRPKKIFEDDDASGISSLWWTAIKKRDDDDLEFGLNGTPNIFDTKFCLF